MTNKQYKSHSLRFFVFTAIITALLSFALSVNAQRMRLRAQVTPNCNVVSGITRWKFADIFADGNIAVQGSYNCRGAFIYDISNPDNPTLSAWYNPGGNQQFLEAIVIGNRGYFGSGNGGGVHIVDLSNPQNPVLLGVVNSTNGNGHNSIHEMLVWGNYLIENANTLSNKIIKFIDISNPANPVFVRDLNPTEAQWVHAMHIRGNRMFTSGWGNSVNRGKTEIYDISNIATQSPVLLGAIEDTSSTTAGNNMHSSWTSEDGNYLYSCRETADGNGDVRVYNISTPSQPMLINRLTMQGLNLNAITPHNPVVMGNKLYVSWYQAGVQVFDLTDPANPVRAGQYDTYQPTFHRSDVDKLALENQPWDLVCGSESLQNALPTSYDGNWAVFPFAGQDRVLAGDMTNGLLVLDASRVNVPAKNSVSDFDGDGKTDHSVFNTQTGIWSIENSGNAAFRAEAFGMIGDKITTGDYDADGKSDVAVFRPSSGIWYVNRSRDGFYAAQFGMNGDIPVAADYDADGKTDIAVFRPSNGVWYIFQSTLGIRIVQWGMNGDLPVVADYEGDGKADIAVFRPSNGVWYALQSSSSIPLFFQWGASTDKPAQADYDGDGKADITVFRPSNGVWYSFRSSDQSVRYTQFGAPEDLPIPADFDGDSKADVSVYRPSVNVWYRLNSVDGSFSAKQFGGVNDVPSPTSVLPN